MDDKIKNIGILLLYQLFFIQIVTGILMHLNLPMTGLNWVIGLMLSYLLCWKVYHTEFKCLFIVIGLWIGAISASILFPDFSTDGQWYHQPMIYALVHGWNPVVQSHNTIISPDWNVNIWSDHYLKGMEILQSSVVSLVGGYLETGKSINLIFPMVTWCILFTCLPVITLNKFGNFGRKKQLLYSFILIAPSITASQLFTYYIDWASYYSILLLSISMLLFLKKRHKDSVIIYIAALYISIGVKFNLTFWIALYMSLAFFCIYLQKSYRSGLKQFIIIGIFTGVSSVLITNYNPYITNIIDHQNIMYPMGSDQIDPNFLQHGAEADYMHNWSRVEKVVYSFFSIPSIQHDYPGIGGLSDLFNGISNPAPVAGGWGVFFPLIFVFSLVIFIMSKRKRGKYIFGICATVLFISLFLLPYGNSYRYLPFTSLIPVIMLCYSEYVQIPCYLRRIRRATYILLLLNFIVPLTLTGMVSLSNRVATDYYVKQIRKSDAEQRFVTVSWTFNYKVTLKNTCSKNVFLDENSKAEYENSINWGRAHIQPLPTYINIKAVDIQNDKNVLERLIVK